MVTLSPGSSPELQSPIPVDAPPGLTPFGLWHPVAPGRVGITVSASAWYRLGAGGPERLVELERLERPVKLRATPLHQVAGNSETRCETSVLAESALTPARPRTDVAVIGYSYPPEGARSWRAGLSLGAHFKEFQLHAPRRWSAQRGGEPVIEYDGPCERVPMRFEYGYGGMDPSAAVPEEAVFAANPAGRGYASSTRSAAGLPLPQIEDPRQPIRSWRDRPLPQASCLMPGSWQLRTRYLDLQRLAATRTETAASGWLAIQWPWYNAAHPDLQLPHLRGDERVTARGFTPGGDLRFQLPGLRLRCRVEWPDGYSLEPMPLDIVMIFAEERTVLLTWRGLVPCSELELPLARGVCIEREPGIELGAPRARVEPVRLPAGLRMEAPSHTALAVKIRGARG